MRRLTRTAIVALITVVFSAATFAQYSQPVLDVENPSQNPFWSVGSGQSLQNLVNFFIELDPVPTGKRLTLEFISMRCTTPADDSIYMARISVFKKPGTSMEYPIQVPRQGTDASGNATWTVSQPLKLYLDSFAWAPKIYVNVFHKNYSAPSGAALCVVDLSGSLVNAP